MTADTISSTTILRLENTNLNLNCAVEFEDNGALFLEAEQGLYYCFSSTSPVVTVIRGIVKVKQSARNEFQCSVNGWTYHVPKNEGLFSEIEEIRVTSNIGSNIIENYVFSNEFPSLKNLKLDLAVKIISIEPYAFANLTNLEYIEINSALVLLDVDSFKRIPKLKSLKLQIINSTTANLIAVLKNHPSLTNLELLNHYSGDICNYQNNDNPLQLLKLQYTGGHLKALSNRCFKCLEYLTELIITNSNLTTLQPGIFAGLDNLITVSLNSLWGLKNETIVFFDSRPDDVILNPKEKGDLSSIEYQNNYTHCYPSEYSFFKICKTSNLTSLSLVMPIVPVQWQPNILKINDNEISSIEENTFINITIKTLIITSTAKSFKITEKSFEGLSNLEFLELKTEAIEFNTYFLDHLKSLITFEIPATDAERCDVYICELVRHSNIKNLLVSDAERMAICDKDICMDRNTKTLSLHYTHGWFTSIERGNFICLPNLENLGISSSTLEEIKPGSFAGLDELTSLILSSNELTQIHQNTFEDLPNLYILILSDNKINNIVNGAFRGKILSMLDLSYNKLTSVSKDLFVDVIIRQLDLSNNELKTIEIGAFKTLNFETLNVDNNDELEGNIRIWSADEDRIPANCFTKASFKICKKLNSLLSVNAVIEKYEGMMFLPDFSLPSKKLELFENLILNVGAIKLKKNLFVQLQSLRYLKIEVIETSFYLSQVLTDLKNLKTLEIVGNHSVGICQNSFSKDIPNTIIDIRYTTGTIDRLQENSLICLPQIEVLTITKSQLSTIEAGAFNLLNNLRYINLSFNTITLVSINVFNSLKSLAVLLLNNNEIEEIDDKAFMLFDNKNFVLYNLSYNELTTIEKDTFDGIKSGQLDLTHNKIRSIEAGAFTDSNIKDLYIFGNPDIHEVKKAWNISISTIVYTKTRICEAFNESNNLVQCHNEFHEYEFQCSVNGWTYHAPKNVRLLSEIEEIRVTSDIGSNIIENYVFSDEFRSLIILILDLPVKNISIEPYAFANLTNLEYIEINSALVLLDVDSFKRMPKLKSLKLQIVNSTTANLIAVLKNHPSLTNLELLNPYTVDICNYQNNNIPLQLLKLQYTGGLSNLEFLELKTVPIKFDTYFLDHLKSLVTFEIPAIDTKRCNISICKLVRRSNIKNLLISDAERVAICDTDLCMDRNTKISSLCSIHGWFTSLHQDDFVCLKRLEYLGIKSSDLENIEPGSFSRLNKLTSLVLSSNKLTQIDQNIFENLTNLNSLVLSDNKMNNIVNGAFRGKTLSVLDLSYNTLTSISKNLFVDVMIKQLDLSNNKLITIEIGAFKTLNFETLNVDNNDELEGNIKI
ncbi:protein artichoke-like [Aphidius gifuensis]|uniref:protein artichoke-like n=1 Tax=Aphidius gifuensis TaxID=684658 RepID=UPI001CDB4D13|nr:protein artichoke-like [Aphidius gifuensis]